ncbi:hypothetical protein Asp14428_22490 [Actinoplanes sp. NBRC 14428]|uniref:Uncharacterized protein n=1 Tax=Pseudosporangium ferrugineum TaxID=439699 RepID=A0A2T0RL89_9ACTN|nr:hypothetical protein [Pseudosporangium ferrugineum]PRY21959.1 hypothetical protein CLV70_11824 [Pseudosporangium ferrugineum]BCJ50774.1 hypothetical protein Asp14428_22490 [Actinoplanes sp. NBRC 14428]
MIRTTTHRPLARRVRFAALATAFAGVALVAAPQAAFASAQGWGGTLRPGEQHCLTASDYAYYQVRADGQATASGARFKVLRNGSVVFGTPSGTIAGFAYEGRSSYGTFAGPGSYTVCATNNNATRTLVNLHIFTDADLPY